MKPLHEHQLNMLADIGEHGSLDTRMIFERHADGRTLRAVQMQLQRFQEESFLYGVQLTVSAVKILKGRKRRITRRRPTVYALTPKGGGAVEAAWGYRPPRVQRGEPSPETLLHRMAIVRTRLAFDASCEAAGLPPPAWIHEADVRSETARKTPPNQRSRLFHRYEVAGKNVACRLDAASRVLLPTGAVGSDPSQSAVILAWEIDLSTEGRKQLRAAKPLALEAWLQHQSYREYWPETNHLAHTVRIAWGVPTTKRIEAITDGAEKPELLGAYRFVTQEDVRTRNLVLDPVWRTSAGGRLPLYVPQTPLRHSPRRSAPAQ